METAKFYTILIAVVTILAVVFLALLAQPLPSATEVETYTEGFEITHMEIDRGRAYVSGRNDNGSFTIKTSGQVFAEYVIGDVCEVEVRVMEQDGKYFNEYTILGLDN